MNDSTLTIEPLLAQVAAADTLEALESARVSLLGKSGAVTEQLKLLGKLPRPQLGLLHRIADVALVPSIYEPFGYTAIETMASGVPIVATDVGGLSEIVQHGEAGLHVPVRPVPGSELREVDVAELASATLSLLNDPARARQLGEASQRRVAELFGLERMIAANIALYRRVLDAP